MGKARQLSQLLSGSGSGTLNPSLVSDQQNNSTGYFDLPAGTAAQRPVPGDAGMVRYNTQAGVLEQYLTTGWSSISAPPVISSVVLPGTQTAVTDGDLITINGSNFSNPTEVKIVSSSNTLYTPGTVTFVSPTQLTCTVTAGLPEGVYNIQTIVSTGLSSTFTNAFTVDGLAVFNTAAGSLGSAIDQITAVNFNCGATEDGSPVTNYAITSGSLPAGLTLNTSTGIITGTPNTNVASDTTYNFTVRAIDSENQAATRNFSITVQSIYGTSQIVTTGLLIHYDFSIASCYPGTGTAITDLAGTQNGTIVNATFGGTGTAKFIDFERDSGNNRVSMGTSIPGTQSSTDLTMEAWVFHESIGGGDGIGAIISSQNDGAGSQGASINTDSRTAHGGGPNGYHFQIGVGSGWSTDGSYGNTAQNTGTVSGHWDHVVAVRSSNGDKWVYENGAPLAFEGNYTGSIRYTSARWQLGAQPDSGGDGRFYDGKIAIARIYNRALTKAEVAQNYAAQSHRFAPYAVTNNTLDILGDSSCIALWRLDNNANDLSGNFNGTASNVTYSSTTKKYGTHSAVFNGTNSTISVPNVRNQYPYTISLWATHDSGWNAPGGLHELFNLNIAGQRVSHGITGAFTTNGITIMYGGTSHWTAPGPAQFGIGSDPNQWHHIVWVVPSSNNASGHKIYLNGNPIAMFDQGGGHGGTATWAIGSNGSGNEFWPGKIDQIRYFNRTLTELEVWQLYNER